MANESKLDNKILRKSLVYGGNYLARIVGNLAQYGTNEISKIATGEVAKEGIKDGLNLGYPYAALGFTTLDILAENFPKIKQSGYYKLAKIGGAATFSALTLSNLIEFIHGNYDGLKDLPFNLSMAASLGYDLKEPGKDFLKNFKNWDWFVGKKNKKSNASK